MADRIRTALQTKLSTLTSSELRDAANAAQIHLNTIYSVSRGTSALSLDTACALCTHLDIPLAAPAGGEHAGG